MLLDVLLPLDAVAALGPLLSDEEGVELVDEESVLAGAASEEDEVVDDVPDAPAVPDVPDVPLELDE